MIRTLIALFASGLIVGMVPGQEPAKSKVEVRSLEVRKPNPADFDSGFGDMNAGTTVHLLFDLPGKYIVEFDERSSKLHHFIDDKGNDLTKAEKKPKYGHKDWLWPFSSQGNDGSRITCDFFGPSTPAIGAAAIKLKADIVILCGSDEKTVDVKDVVFDSKLNLKAGPFNLDRGKTLFTSESTLSLTCSENKFIKSVSFQAPDGKITKAGSEGSSRITVLGKSSYVWHFSLTGAPPQGTLRVVYLDKLDPVTVPVDLQIGVGF